MNIIQSVHMFSPRGRLDPARPKASHHWAAKPIPTDGEPAAKQRLFKPILPNHRATSDGTVIAWPTNIQSTTPDGMFGPANIMSSWGDCWFLAVLAAVANDPEGHKILAESIKEVNGGYDVTFKGSPNHTIFISNSELDQFLAKNGGDADTRLMELAADKFFSKSGHYKSLFVASLMSGGLDQEGAEQCIQDLYRNGMIRHPMTHNPMRDGGPAVLAFFMFTGRYSDLILAGHSTILQREHVMNFFNQYATNDRDGTSIVLAGIENPLGNGRYVRDLVVLWDVIRTDITANGTVDSKQQGFLNALIKWLDTRDYNNLKDLELAAADLQLEHIHPLSFVNVLAKNQYYMHPEHFNVLRSGVQEVLGGGPGYIGFTDSHYGTIEGFDEEANRFTYSEPNYPSLVHTGELADLIRAIINKKAWLSAVKPATGQDEAESSHAGEKRGRHLRQIHQQAVRDGTIDPAESGPLANLMEMDDSVFRKIYDSDTNGMIEGGELKPVQLRVDRWVDHFQLTPIW